MINKKNFYFCLLAAIYCTIQSKHTAINQLTCENKDTATEQTDTSTKQTETYPAELQNICKHSSVSTACLALCGAVTENTDQMEGCADCLEYARQAHPDVEPSQPCNINLYGRCGLVEHKATEDAAQSLKNLCTEAFDARQTPDAGMIGGWDPQAALDFERDAIVNDYVNDCIATCYSQAIADDGSFLKDPTYYTRSTTHEVDGKTVYAEETRLVKRSGAYACINAVKNLKTFAMQTNLTNFDDMHLENGDLELIYFNALAGAQAQCPLLPAQIEPKKPEGSALSFKGTILTNANLSNLNLSGTPNAPTVFDHANLDEANFHSAILGNVKFLNKTSLKKADLQSAWVDETIFKNCEAQDLQLGGASLTDTQIMQSDVSSSDFTGALFGNVTIDNSDVSDSIFFPIYQATKTIDKGPCDTEEQEYPFTLTAINKTNLDRANFYHTTFGQGKLIIKDSSAKTSFWPGAKIAGATLVNSDFSSASFYNADATGAAFTKSTFFGTYFGGTKLTDVIVDLDNYNGFHSLWFANDLDKAVDTETITSVNPAGEVYNTKLYNEILNQINPAATT